MSKINQTNNFKLKTILIKASVLIIIFCSIFYFIKETNLFNANNEIYKAEFLIQELVTPSSPGAMAPRLTITGDHLSMSWLEPYTKEISTLKGSSSQLRWSKWDGQAWSTPATVASSSHMFSNFADIPSVISTNNGNLYAHWLEKSTTGDYGYDVMLASKKDTVDEWKALGAVWKESHSNRQGYDGFASMIPEHDGMRIFWIDGRLYDKANGKPMRLMTAKLADNIRQETLLDDNICSCCDTTAVMTSAGPVVFYRGRTQDEIRDIMTVRLQNNNWSSPVPVAQDNWQIAGCPVNGPKADAFDQQIVVVWFTGVSGKGDVRFAYSNDSGKSFSLSKAIDTISPNGPVGRADVELLENGDAIISWIGQTPNTNKHVIFLRRVNSQGVQGPYIQVAEVTTNRSVGFPQIERVGDQLFLAWTDPKNNKSGNSVHDKVDGIKIVKLDINTIPHIKTP